MTTEITVDATYLANLAKRVRDEKQEAAKEKAKQDYEESITGCLSMCEAAAARGYDTAEYQFNTMKGRLVDDAIVAELKRRGITTTVGSSMYDDSKYYFYKMTWTPAPTSNE